MIDHPERNVRILGEAGLELRLRAGPWQHAIAELVGGQFALRVLPDAVGADLPHARLHQQVAHHVQPAARPMDAVEPPDAKGRSPGIRGPRVGGQQHEARGLAPELATGQVLRDREADVEVAQHRLVQGDGERAHAPVLRPAGDIHHAGIRGAPARVVGDLPVHGDGVDLVVAGVGETHGEGRVVRRIEDVVRPGRGDLDIHRTAFQRHGQDMHRAGRAAGLAARPLQPDRFRELDVEMLVPLAEVGRLGAQQVGYRPHLEGEKHFVDRQGLLRRAGRQAAAGDRSDLDHVGGERPAGLRRKHHGRVGEGLVAAAAAVGVVQAEARHPEREDGDLGRGRLHRAEDMGAQVVRRGHGEDDRLRAAVEGAAGRVVVAVGRIDALLQPAAEPHVDLVARLRVEKRHAGHRVHRRGGEARNLGEQPAGGPRAGVGRQVERQVGRRPQRRPVVGVDQLVAVHEHDAPRRWRRRGRHDAEIATVQPQVQAPRGVLQAQREGVGQRRGKRRIAAADHHAFRVGVEGEVRLEEVHRGAVLLPRARQREAPAHVDLGRSRQRQRVRIRRAADPEVFQRGGRQAAFGDQRQGGDRAGRTGEAELPRRIDLHPQAADEAQ